MHYSSKSLSWEGGQGLEVGIIPISTFCFYTNGNILSKLVNILLLNLLIAWRLLHVNT